MLESGGSGFGHCGIFDGDLEEGVVVKFGRRLRLRFLVSVGGGVLGVGLSLARCGGGVLGVGLSLICDEVWLGLGEEDGVEGLGGL